MRRHAPTAAFAALVLLALVALALWPEPVGPEPEPAVAAPAPRERAPLARPRTWPLPQPGSRAEDPEPEEVPAPDPEVPVAKEALRAFVGAGNEALGNGWQACVKPWMDATDSVEEPPIVLNLVITDGRVTDLELVSPAELDPELVACFADAAWEADFPEDPAHRGQVRVQRTMGLR